MNSMNHTKRQFLSIYSRLHVSAIIASHHWAFLNADTGKIYCNKTEVSPFTLKILYKCIRPSKYIRNMKNVQPWNACICVCVYIYPPPPVALRPNASRTPLDRPLPDNTQNSQQTGIHAPIGIRTHNLSGRAAADLRFRPRDHWDRHIYIYIYTHTHMHMPVPVAQ